MKRKSSAVDLSETESKASSHQSKRPKYSTEPSEVNAPAPSASEATPSLVPKSPYPAIIVPDVVFSAEDVIKAQERAKELSAMFEAERTSRREAFEAAQKRATRRANDAEQKLTEAAQEYALKLKVEKTVNTKELANLTEQCDAANCRAAELARELEACKLENQKLKEAPTPSAADCLLRQQLATQESQLKLYDQLRSSLTTEARKPRDLSKRLKHESNEYNVQQSLLTTLVNRLHDEFEDLSNKAMMKYVKEIQQRNQDLAKQRSVELGALDDMIVATEEFTAPFTIEEAAAPQLEELAKPGAEAEKPASWPEKLSLR